MPKRSQSRPPSNAYGDRSEAYRPYDGGGKRQRREPSRGNSNRRGCTVFVGNLSPTTSWQTLKDHMRKSGNVDSANVLTHRDGRSKECALVDYQHPKEAQRALRELDRSVLEGREIVVRPDEAPERGESRNGSHNRTTYDNRSSGSYSHAATGRDSSQRRSSSTLQDSSSSSPTTVYVGNIPFECTAAELRNPFSRFGKITSLELPKKPNGKSKGFALIDYASSKAANAAIRQMNRVEFQERNLDVSWARNTENETPSGGGSPIVLFVGNLPEHTRWQDLKDHIRATSGPVAEDIQVYEGRKMSYATVALKNGISVENAKHCIERLNNSHLQGNELEVRFDRSSSNLTDTHQQQEQHMQQRPKRSSSSSLSLPPLSQPNCVIFVKNLSYDTRWQGLKDYIRKICGSGVQSVDINETPDGKSKGNALARFATSQQATESVSKLDGTELDGRVLEVRMDRNAGTDGKVVKKRINGNKERKSPSKSGTSKRRSSDDMVDEEYNLEAALSGALSASR